MAKPRRRVFRPNSFSARVRVLTVLAATFMLAYCIAELAVGYTYLPGKRGGAILSGGPTLMIALSALLFCVSSLSVVVDHYDTRDNETLYKRARASTAKAGGALLVLAPVVELVLSLVRAFGGQTPFFYRGFAEDVPLHIPAWRNSSAHLELLLLDGFVGRLMLVSVALAALVYLADRLRLRVALVLKLGVSLLVVLLFSLILLVSSVRQVVTGEAKVRRQVITASEHTAQFNAVLVTRTFAGVFFLLTGSVTGVLLVRRRGRLPFD